MTSVFLFSQIAPADCARVWLGVTGRNAAPTVHWTIDGVAAVPTALRALAPVWSAGSAGTARASQTWSGIFEFAGLQPGTHHIIEARVGNETCRRGTRTLPARVPELGFHIMLSSCFHRREANTGNLRRAVSALTAACWRDGEQPGPDMAILLGDQVYLDLPTLEKLPTDLVGLSQRFEGKYRDNWFDTVGLPDLLGAAPYVATADDHEFWNNAPHRSPIVPHSWSDTSRGNWRDAATMLFNGFQAGVPLAPGMPLYPLIIDVPPVSVFVADTRLDRTDEQLMNQDSRTRLGEWITHINDRRLHGVFVSGQSLFSKAVSRLRGSAADWEMANYPDFGEIVSHIARAKQPLICVTGDVHWGRVLAAQSRNPDVNGDVYEVITSPTALVTTVGVDHLKRATNFVRGLVGRRDPWPRHAEPSTTIGPFANDRPGAGKPHSNGEILTTDDGRRVTLRGDQIALLSFELHGPKLTARVRYWTLDEVGSRAIDATVYRHHHTASLMQEDAHV